MFKKSTWIVGVVALTLCASPVLAKVSQEEAARLGKDLTPWGAEMAGNAEGTIPAWTGGVKTPASWQAPNGHRPDPYAGDKVEFTITAANYQQYADKLTAGEKAFFEKYPDTFKMNVYPSRRGHDLPDWVKENIAKNAVTAELVDDGNGIANAYGGAPFPIPQNGNEAIWNHLTMFQGQSMLIPGSEYLVNPNGYVSIDATFKMLRRHDFYRQGSSLQETSGVLNKIFWESLTPASEAGGGILIHDYVNAATNPRKAWMYSPGERRVRRAPTLNFDSPNRSITTYDDDFVYNGSPERYDWKLVGKQEIYIPYNCYKLTHKDSDLKDINIAKHINPDYVRYELHRVWVVEATLKQGKRHIYAKRTFYIDEDSWMAVEASNYDKGGELWRTVVSYQKTFYDVPLTTWGVYITSDLKNGIYNAFGYPNASPSGMDFSMAPPDDTFFTPAALRRRGRR